MGMDVNRRPVPSSTTTADSLRAETNTLPVFASTARSTGRLPRLIGRLVPGRPGSLTHTTPEPSAIKTRPLFGFTSRPAGRPPMTVPLAVAGVVTGVGDGMGVGIGVGDGS